MQYLLEAIAATKQPIDDSVLDIYKALKPQMGESEELEIIIKQAAEMFPSNTFVEIIGTNYVGEVVSYNKSLGGLYPGVRYPVNVKIIHSPSERFKTAIGKVFEYTFDNLSVIDANKLAFHDVLNDYPKRPHFDNPNYVIDEYLKHYDEWSTLK